MPKVLGEATGAVSGGRDLGHHLIALRGEGIEGGAVGVGGVAHDLRTGFVGVGTGLLQQLRRWHLDRGLPGVSVAAAMSSESGSTDTWVL